ncbi:MAG: UDP-N-acetylmuramate:L-alanyl-gamma-D-glutamyl-meso-diaminopimelate ligase [Desulfosudaceae bacterium]
MPDKSLNIIPDRVGTIHLVAACGTGMAALACLLRDLGYQVTGSDHNVYPPMSDLLADRGIPVAAGFAAENLAHQPDLVVVGNAVSGDNPEAVAVREMRLPYCSMPQALNHFLANDKSVLMVCGTHGKTTTTALLAWMLQTAGLDPSFMIGGLVRNFDGNYRLGQGPHMVIEGDEYDTAFFDKTSKFLHYRPAVTVVTGVEFDHADIFADLAEVKASFGELLSGLSPDSRLFAFDADQNLADLVKQARPVVEFYGESPEAAWRLEQVRLLPPKSEFTVMKNGRFYGRFVTPLAGRYNLVNALAALAVADSVGVTREKIGQALDSFSGVKRRQEVRGVKNGITVMDDFAHHPTAVAATIAGIRPFYPEGRLIAVFEPRTNTSMRDVFQKDYAGAFEGADLVCVSDPPFPRKIPEGHRFSSVRLAADLNSPKRPAFRFPDAAAIVDFLARQARSGDLILVMSNGGFDNIQEKLLARL